MSAEIVLRRVELRLTHAHRAAHGTVTTRPTLIVEFRTTLDGEVRSGWGECPALPQPGYSHEYTDGAQAVLTDVLIPAVVGGGSLEPEAVWAATGAGAGHPMARSALALAAEDLSARRRGRTLAQVLGASTSTLSAGTTISAAPPGDPSEAEGVLDDLGERAVAHARAGYRRLKLKIEPGWDEAPASSVLAALREAGQSEVEVAVDANGAYRHDDPGHATALRRLDALGLAWIEQPYPAGSLVELADLGHELTTPICLDEAATGPDALRTAHALGLRPVVCVKAARLGGPTAAREVLAWCEDQELDAYVGGMLSSGVGRAADRALAALPGATRVGDIGADDQYFEADLTTPRVTLRAGRVPVVADPNTGGLGVSIERSALEALTGHTQRWSMP